MWQLMWLVCMFKLPNKWLFDLFFRQSWLYTSFCKIYVLNFVVSTISRTKFGYKSVWSYFFNPLCAWFIRRYICSSIKKFIWLKLHMNGRFNRHMIGWEKITLKESTWHCRYLSRLRRRWSGWLYFSLTSPLLFSINTGKKG